MIAKLIESARIPGICVVAALGFLAAACTTVPAQNTTSIARPCDDGAPLICETAYTTRIGAAASAVPATCRCSTLITVN